MANAKFTQKVEQYLATAAELATESSHQQLSPVHLAIAMFEDPEGIGKQSAVKAGGERQRYSGVVPARAKQAEEETAGCVCGCEIEQFQQWDQLL
jgi:ATP-dependent Clp protease ATP-binding subunit ClpB